SGAYCSRFVGSVEDASYPGGEIGGGLRNGVEFSRPKGRLEKVRDAQAFPRIHLWRKDCRIAGRTRGEESHRGYFPGLPRPRAFLLELFMVQPRSGARALPPWIVILASAAVVFHLFAVVVLAVAAPSGPWPTSFGTSMALEPQFAQSISTITTRQYL